MKQNMQAHFIFGLGNPGRKYENTRHNVGFDVVNILARRCGVRLREKPKLEAALADGILDGCRVMLAEPQTYMNLSGYAVSAILDYYDAGPKDAIVVYDDIDLPFGAIRIRGKGSAGTHNGMRSVVGYLGTEDFVRVRVGIGRPEGRTPLAAYVLSRFPDPGKVQEVFERAADAVECVVSRGIAAAQQIYHTEQIKQDGASD